MTKKATRRDLLQGVALTAAGALVGAADEAAASGASGENAPDDPNAFPRYHRGRGGPIGSASDRGKLTPGRRGYGQPPVPVEMPDLPKLPWKMVDGAKEFHLVPEVVKRELLPGMTFHVWGFNGTMPGPLIEVNQGDRVRFVVENRLPEPTSMHWHGIEMPNRFDGVEGLTQEPIPPGKTFVYEFDLHQEGSYFYHSHGAMQEIMGMAGMLIIHPEKTYDPPVDHDFALIFQEFAILPQADVPNSLSMDFNFFTINGKSGPLTTPLVVRHGSRVRLRLMNLSAMDHHPIHFHGHTWWNTGTEGGRIPESAWIPGNTQLVGVAQVRDMEFIANNPGDWVLHCHIPHHMMNHMTSMTGPMAMRMLRQMHQGGGMGHRAGQAAVHAANVRQGGQRFGGRGAGGGGAGITGLGAPGSSISESLRGPFASDPHHAGLDVPAGADMAEGEGMIVHGPALSREHGTSLGRGMGPQTAMDHARRNGEPMGGKMVDYNDPRWLVRGFPQDMMNMKEMHYTDDAVKQIKEERNETNGMRHNWFIGIEAMMTTLRVLPDELYDKVMGGEPVSDGASVPGPEDERKHGKDAPDK